MSVSLIALCCAVGDGRQEGRTNRRKENKNDERKKERKEREMGERRMDDRIGGRKEGREKKKRTLRVYFAPGCIFLTSWWFFLRKASSSCRPSICISRSDLVRVVWSSRRRRLPMSASTDWRIISSWSYLPQVCGEHRNGVRPCDYMQSSDIKNKNRHNKLKYGVRHRMQKMPMQIATS